MSGVENSISERIASVEQTSINHNTSFTTGNKEQRYVESPEHMLRDYCKKSARSGGGR